MLAAAVMIGCNLAAIDVVCVCIVDVFVEIYDDAWSMLTRDLAEMYPHGQRIYLL